MQTIQIICGAFALNARWKTRCDRRLERHTRLKSHARFGEGIMDNVIAMAE